jgi:hypothetical protein
LDISVFAGANLKHWQVPLAYWPLSVHGLMCVSIALLTGLIAAYAQGYNSTKLRALQAQSSAMQMRLAAQVSPDTTFIAQDWQQRLPQTNQTDDLLRDVVRYARDYGVQIATLTVERLQPSSLQLGRMQINISGLAPYMSTKAWLSDVLGRYPALTVSAFALQAIPSDVARQDLHVSLCFYIRL